MTDTKIEHYDSEIPLGPWPAVRSPHIAHQDGVHGHLSTVQRRYYSLPRDDGGYPIIPEGAAEAILEYARARHYPLPGQNRISVEEPDSLAIIVRWLSAGEGRAVTLANESGRGTYVWAADQHDAPRILIEHTAANTDLALWSLARVIEGRSKG